MGKKNKGGGKKKQTKEDKDILPEVDKEFYEIQITDLNQKLTRQFKELRMPPKKNKALKTVNEGQKEVLPEIDKEFYEIKIVDLNEKLARLRSRCAELETENEDIKGNLNKLDEDRADIIAYLQRTLQAKSDEIVELQERLTALQQARETERASFLDKIKNMEHDFKVMHEQLTSEIKLLNGKLNSLEEFRSHREELMKKFVVQEEAMEEQEKRHKITLYEVERKFIVGKDELKKDMESKLLQLSLDFQNTTDIRIAATTQRVIRENVAINNELRILMESWKKLKDDHDELRQKEKEMKLQVVLQNEEKITVMKKNSTQTKMIKRLSDMYNKLADAYVEFDQVKKYSQHLEKKLEIQSQELQTAKEQTQILKRNLYAREVEENEVEINLRESIKQILELKEIIQTAAVAVKEAIIVQEEPGSDTSLNLSRREALLTMLLEIFNKANNLKGYELEDKVSMETISLHHLDLVGSYSYTSGDLGLIPKTSGKFSEKSFPTCKKSVTSSNMTKASSKDISPVQPISGSAKSISSSIKSTKIKLKSIDQTSEPE